MNRPDFTSTKVIIFDIDNTLLDFKKCAQKSIIEAFQKWKIPYNDKIMPVFLSINQKYWSRYEAGEITRDYLYKNRWKEIFEILNIPVSGENFEKDFVRNLYMSHETVEDADVVLNYLKPKYKLAIASNSSYDEQSTRLGGAGLLSYFDMFWTSEDIGAAKPNRVFFDTVYRDLGENIRKEEVLMVGDSINADIKGSRDYGFKTAWFNFENKPVIVDADFSFTKLRELITVL